MTHPQTPHHLLALLSIAVIVALSLLAVAPAIATAQGDGEAQCLKPEAPQPQESPPIETLPTELKWVVFNGDVTIGGELPSRQGYTITVTIGRYWESTAVPVGVGGGCGSMRYAHLMVAIPEELIWDGSQIEFWLSGQVMSAVYHWYSPTDYRYTSNIGDFPFLRRVNLGFPHPAILWHEQVRWCEQELMIGDWC